MSRAHTALTLSEPPTEQITVTGATEAAIGYTGVTAIAELPTSHVR
jgi:hypothetical protein